jgi:hypothetical protein
VSGPKTCFSESQELTAASDSNKKGQAFARPFYQSFLKQISEEE